MTITMSKEMRKKINSMNIEKDFLDALAKEFENEYVDPNGETAFVFEYEGGRYLVEGRVHGDIAILADIGPVKTLQAK